MRFAPSETSRAGLLLAYVEDQMTDVGNVVPYETALDICGIDPADVDGRPSQTLAPVVDEVNKRLHRAGDWRHLQSIDNVGYAVAAVAGIRAEVMGRNRAAIRQQVKALRAAEKVIRHPDATAAERKQAADAAASQAALVMATKREARSIRTRWPDGERSPVDSSDLNQSPAPAG